MFMPMMMMMMMMMMRVMMTTMLMRLLPLTVKILSIEMSLKRGLNEGTLGNLRGTLGTLGGTLMTMRHWMVVNLMQTMLLVSKTLRINALLHDRLVTSCSTLLTDKSKTSILQLFNI